MRPRVAPQRSGSSVGNGTRLGIHLTAGAAMIIGPPGRRTC
jgi:hypothetical protein